jgi:hypothetical protein
MPLTMQILPCHFAIPNMGNSSLSVWPVDYVDAAEDLYGVWLASTCLSQAFC